MTAHPRRLAAPLLVILLALGSGCASVSPGGMSSTETGRATDYGQYTRVLVRDFRDRFTSPTERIPLDELQERKALLAEASKTLPDAVAEALRAQGAFAEVLRSGTPTASTLVVDGDILKLYGENDLARRATRGRTGEALAEVRVQLHDGATGTLLGSFLAQSGPGGVDRTAHAPATLETATETVVRRIADEVSATRRGSAR